MPFSCTQCRCEPLCSGLCDCVSCVLGSVVVAHASGWSCRLPRPPLLAVRRLHLVMRTLRALLLPLLRPRAHAPTLLPLLVTPYWGVTCSLHVAPRRCRQTSLPLPLPSPPLAEPVSALRHRLRILSTHHLQRHPLLHSRPQLSTSWHFDLSPHMAMMIGDAVTFEA